MSIVQISAELCPVIKVGSLGNVVYGLSWELESKGNCIELIF